MALEVRRFRTFVEDGLDVTGLAADLASRLLGPAAEDITESDRLLIVPDGPLHYLPFAALGDPSSIDGSFRYLLESRALHTVVSGTVYGEMLKERSRDERTRLVAFGDPDLSGLSAEGYGYLADLPELPATRDEVEAILGLMSEEAECYLGAEATEEAAKERWPEAGRIHIACHALLDESSPLDSALILAPGTAHDGLGDDGILNAWEIFERIRLEADLVVLSACDTGLGHLARGEGLIGLSRAFQFAGARSVLASLWQVSDTSTAVLMKRFYLYLLGGLSKDEALRQAQLDMLRDPLEIEGSSGRLYRVSVAHPFYWAGFHLIGDWK